MIKNIPQAISLPIPPPQNSDIDSYAKELGVWIDSLYSSLEEYTRTLADTVSEQPRYDDYRVPFTRDKQGQTSLPDFDFTNLGLLFPQNDATEIVYLICQMPHSWRMGTPIHPHVHFIQSSSSVPVFKMDYRVYGDGETPPATWTTIETSDLKYDYSSGDMLQKAYFPEIDMKDVLLSSFIDVKFYRDDNVVSGDVLVKEWDFHYMLDGLGSREEDRK